ncbi:MAG TPA: site-2 protease family protein [Ktedonobacterales bacterium]|nr:site-2 protease family protein [Ktedonobacterales bacterium]
MSGSFSLGKNAGVRIDINVSWLVILVLLTVSLATADLPASATGYGAGAYWNAGVVASLLFFASVLLHELGHSLVARARGLPVSSITLFIFGGVSNLEQEPHSPGEEFVVAVIGPVISLVLGALLLLLGLAVGRAQTLVAAVLVYVGGTNLLLGAFNLIPGFPLDGGRVLRSILWRTTGSLRTATRWAAWVGQGFGYLFILFGVLQFFSGNVFGGIWIGFIGWFLLNAAQTANRQVMVDSLLRGLTVRGVMAPPPTSVSADLSLQDLVDSHALPYGLRAIPVVAQERFAGLMTLADVRSVPRADWPQTPVGQAMVPLERLHAVSPEQPLNEVLPLMAERDVNQLPVVQEEHLVGMLSRDALLRVLAVRQSVGVASGRGGGVAVASATHAKEQVLIPHVPNVPGTA